MIIAGVISHKRDYPSDKFLGVKQSLIIALKSIPAMMTVVIILGGIVGGIFTPTEAFNAISAGAKILKLFPGSAVGPEYIKALKGPFPDIEIVPTGGVSLSNVKDWFKAGAVAVGMGSNLIPKEAVEKENYAEITKRAKDFVREIHDKLPYN